MATIIQPTDCGIASGEPMTTKRIRSGFRFRLIVGKVARLVVLTCFGIFILPVLYLIWPFMHIKLGYLNAARIGDLIIHADFFLRRKQLFSVPANTRHVFFSSLTSNAQLLKMFRRHLTIFTNRWFPRIFSAILPLLEHTRFYEVLSMEDCRAYSNAYYGFNHGTKTLSFNQEEELMGQKGLREMGISETDWYVCIFARDSHYLKTLHQYKDWSYHDYRDSDIDAFRSTIDYIVSLGGYVVRMGYLAGKRLDYKHERVIDYAFDYRTDFLDVYLPAHCKFYIGTASGCQNLAWLFDVPSVCVNWVPVGMPPFGKNNIYIPKKVKNRKTDEHMSYKYLIRNKSEQMHDGNKFREMGFEYEENSSSDILKLTKEMMERLDGDFEYSEKEQAMTKQYYGLFIPENLAYGVNTPIGRDFLNENKHLFEIS